MAQQLNRFYDWIRHPSAGAIASQRVSAQGFEHLSGHKYCLLISYRRGGEAVPTAVWFGLADGSAYVRTEAAAAKIARVRNNPRVLLAPCGVRGKPLGPAAEGRARVLEQGADEQRAEAALRANYGLGRRLYERAGAAVATVYLEVEPVLAA